MWSKLAFLVTLVVGLGMAFVSSLLVEVFSPSVHAWYVAWFVASVVGGPLAKNVGVVGAVGVAGHVVVGRQGEGNIDLLLLILLVQNTS